MKLLKTALAIIGIVVLSLGLGGVYRKGVNDGCRRAVFKIVSDQRGPPPPGFPVDQFLDRVCTIILENNT